MIFKIVISLTLISQSEYNRCYEGDVVEVGNLENMEKNKNGIRWFETQHSENCRFTNTVEHLDDWKTDFEPNGEFKNYYTIEL